MLDTLRNSAKSWVAKILLAGLAASFGLWGIADVFRGFNTGDLAEVGKVTITPQEYTRTFERQLQRISQQSGQAMTREEARQLGFDRQTLDQLINAAAIDNQAQKLGLAVPTTLIVQAAHNVPAFQNPPGTFDPSTFRQVLQNNGFTEEGYLQSERQGYVRSALTDTVTSNLPVPKSMLEALYRFRNEERDVRYIVVKTADSEVAQPNDADIKAKYEANAAAYTAPEYRRVAILTVEPSDIAPRLQVSDADLQAAYEKNKADYFTPERRTVLQMTFPTLEEAQKAKEQLNSGTDFLALAQQRGLKDTDITFADKAKTDFLDPTIAEAAFKLGEGQVSDPVRGSIATAILKVVKITPEHQESFDEAKAALSERVKLEQAHSEIDDIYGAVEDARGAQTKFEDIAKAQNIKFTDLGLVDAGGLDPNGKPVDMPMKDELLKAVAQSDVGVDTAAINTKDGFVWYDVREVVPSKLKPLETVRDQVIKDIIAERVSKQSLEKAQKLVDRAKNGETLDALAKELNATVDTVRGLKREQPSGSINAAATAAIFAVSDTGFAAALANDPATALVMQAQPVLLPPFDANSQEAKTLAQFLQTSIGGDLLMAYTGELKNTAGVKINEKAWNVVAGGPAQ